METFLWCSFVIKYVTRVFLGIYSPNITLHTKSFILKKKNMTTKAVSKGKGGTQINQTTTIWVIFRILGPPLLPQMHTGKWKTTRKASRAPWPCLTLAHSAPKPWPLKGKDFGLRNAQQGLAALSQTIPWNQRPCVSQSAIHIQQFPEENTCGDVRRTKGRFWKSKNQLKHSFHPLQALNSDQPDFAESSTHTSFFWSWRHAPGTRVHRQLLLNGAACAPFSLCPIPLPGLSLCASQIPIKWTRSPNTGLFVTSQFSEFSLPGIFSQTYHSFSSITATQISPGKLVARFPEHLWL